jgi:hypothetical protein
MVSRRLDEVDERRFASGTMMPWEFERDGATWAGP